MATWNKELHNLTRDDVERISLEYLMGWQDLIGNGYTFRIKGFNHMREKFGMKPLTRKMSLEYRVEYVKSHFTYDEIREQIKDYMRTARVGNTRWTGIELFDCRFGRDYAVAFRQLLGDDEYNSLAEELRNQKSIEKQIALYGGIGLAGEATKSKAMATNLVRYGGTNVMDDLVVRERVAHTNTVLYGGVSPFNSADVRRKGTTEKRLELYAAIREYEQAHNVSGLVCESFGEFIAFQQLVEKFGFDDVYLQYGLNPYDARYPYNCDIYVKSLDIFIELNFYFVHGKHWFDANSAKDVDQVRKWRDTGSCKCLKAIEIWTHNDVEKRAVAKQSGIKYLVFWYKNTAFYGLGEFNTWFYNYDCDYNSFVHDHPENTY
ncbi:MAG: hypothetical protein U0L73_12005 [Ruminococcus bromii]|nr:hypothetical protein [Ruminococcus bromii]